MPLDIAFGILSAIFVTQTTHLSLGFSTILFGIIFSLLPDVDFLLYITKRKPDEMSHEHRNIFHYPLLFIPIGFIILAFININLAFLFALCSLFHFLHDSVGIGWGVRFLYPFSKKYYKFFSDKNGKPSRQFLVSWTKEEQKQIASQFGNPNWLSDYLKFSREFIVELLLFVISIIFLIYILSH